MNIAGYRQFLDPHVRPERFGRDWGVLVHLTAHLTLVVGVSIFVAMHVQTLPWFAWVGLAVLAGHSVGILAFAAHEVGHGAVLRARAPRYVAELLGWTFALFTSSTVQRRAHNQLHHLYANTPRDPDRRPTLDELAPYPGGAKLTEAIFPNVRAHWLMSLLGFHASICSYHNRLLWHSVLQKGTLYDTRMTAKERRRALLEFGWNAGAYFALFALSGFHPAMAGYLWLMYAAATTLDGIYIATNHMLTAQQDTPGEGDPIQQTVSLIMPRWVDFLHLGFSHHTEHHLYPTAGRKHYPAIRAALREHVPHLYHELTLPQALKALYASPLAVSAPGMLACVDGSGECPVAFPLVPSELVRVVPQATGVEDAPAPLA